MSVSVEWFRRNEELGGAERRNRDRLEAAFIQAFLNKAEWIAKVIREETEGFRIQFVDMNGRSRGPTIPFSWMASFSDIRDATSFLR
jgi:hypothetical protein